MLAQGIDITQLITRLKFDTTVATPKLFFKPMRWLTPEEYEICQAQGLVPDAIKAITMTVSQMDGVQPVASAPAPFQAPAAAPAPTKPAALPPEDDEPPAPPPATRTRKPKAAAAPAPEPEAPVPEPTVRTAPPAASTRAPATSTLLETLNQWDDE